MRIGLAVLLAGCAFHAHAAGGDDGSAATNALIDDSAADFENLGTVLGVAIDPGGVLEPEAYVRGGLRARAYDGKYISGTTASWAAIETAVGSATERGVAYGQMPANWGGNHPTGLGLTADTMPDDNFTVLYDGELLVTAGDHAIDIDGDDAGAIDINGAFVVDASGGVQSLAIHADADTWIPIRLGIGEGTGNAQLVVRFDGMPLTAAQMRAPVTDERGLATIVYYTMGPNELQAGPVLAAPNVNWGMAAPPYDLPGVPAGAYTARFMGQVHIDADGTYTFATTTTSADDATQIFIDGHLLSRTGGFPDSHPATATLALTAGWHGIVIELDASQQTILGTADPHAVTLATTIAGPDGIAMPLTADRLRPAVPSGYLSLAFTAQTALNDTVMMTGVTTVGVPVTVPAQPAGAVIDSALVGYFYHHATPTDYAVTLDMAGTPKTLPSTDPYLLVFGDETSAGQPVPTAANAWTFTFTDSVAGNASGFGDPSVFGLAVLTSHGGRQMPFEPKWTYISSPRSVGDGVTAWGPLTVTASLGGAAMVISMRSAPTADDLLTATFVDVPNGSVPAVPVNPFVEYAIAVAGDGWQYPTVDKVELDYTR